MRNVSRQYIETMKERRNFYAVAEITFVNGKTKSLEKGDFSISDNSITESAESNSFPLGILAAKRIAISLVNDDDRWFSYAFYGARIFLKTKYELNDGTIETLNIGTFTVITPENYGTTVVITAMDDSYKTDVAYSTMLSYPVTAGEALQDSCQTCGVTLLTMNFPNSDYEIPVKPENITHRHLIGLVAMIAGGNAAFDENSRLIIKPYDFSAFEKSSDEWGGIFDNLAEEQYMTGDDVSGGVFEPWDVGEVDEPVFSDLKNIPVFSDFVPGMSVGNDDVVITGLQITGTDEDGNEVARLYGEDGYVLSFENQLATGKEDEVAERIGKSIVGLRFRPFSGDHISYPMAEFMDLAYITDRSGRAYRAVLTDVNFAYYGFTSLKCTADSPIRNSSVYYGSETNTIVQARKEAKKQIDQYGRAMQELNGIMANSLGLYTTTKQTESGGVILYQHDKPMLEESKNIWEKSENGFRVSSDGGLTWNSGWDSSGNAVLNALSVTGFSFDWATGGRIFISPDQNNAMGIYVFNAYGSQYGRWDEHGLDLQEGMLTSRTLAGQGDAASDFSICQGVLTFYAPIENAAVGRHLIDINSAKITKPGTISEKITGIIISSFIENDFILLGYRFSNGHLNYDYIYNPRQAYSNSGDTHIFESGVRIHELNMSTMGKIFFGRDKTYLEWTSSYLSPMNHYKPAVCVREGGLVVDYFITTDGIVEEATASYSKISLNTLGASSPNFIDTGSGEVAEDGQVYVFIDPVFAETIDSNSEYQVFITRTSEKQTEWVEKNNGYFIVHGEPKATFDWMLYAPRKNTTATRLEPIEIPKNDYIVFDDSIFSQDESALIALEKENEEYEKEIELL